MIVGIGTDIVEVERIRKSLERWGERFQGTILSELETRNLHDMDLASAYLARQFAAKEAVVKALGTGINHGVDLRDILVLRLASGAPVVELRGIAGKYADRQGIGTVLVSISAEKAYAIAYAIALSKATDPQANGSSDTG